MVARCAVPVSKRSTLAQHGETRSRTYQSLTFAPHWVSQRTNQQRVTVALHSWFSSDLGTTLTSHNGSTRHPDGSLDSYLDAYEDGFRWMQVDGVPTKDGLFSHHAYLGLWSRYRNKNRRWMEEHLPGRPTLYDLLTHECLKDVRWNIEVKSRLATNLLVELLRKLRAENVDLRRILVSSPIWPKTGAAVAAEFPDVALAAPVVHGGALGFRFRGSNRAQPIVGRSYDVEQIWHVLVRGRRQNGPLRQAWTVTRARTFERLLTTDAHCIVDGDKLRLRRGRYRSVEPLSLADVDTVSLGGGGWRGAFGGIGTIGYLMARQRWTLSHR